MKQPHVIYVVICLFALMISTSPASDLSLDSLVSKIQSNQNMIKDMYAETITTITSNIAMPGSGSGEPQKMVQKGKMWTKGTDKSKIETISPMKQITITNGDQMAIINPENGQKVVRETEEMKNSSSLNLEKIKEYFDLSLTKKDDGYLITGVPKKENKILGKMEFYIDDAKWVPNKIIVYDAKGKPISQSDVEYKDIAGIWVPIRNVSLVNTPMGKMNIEMEYKNIQINKGIKEEEFQI